MSFPPPMIQGRANALLTMSTPGVAWRGLGRLQAHDDHYATVYALADDCELADTTIGFGANTAKGITIHCDEREGGFWIGRQLTIERAPGPKRIGVQCDPGYRGRLSLFQLESVRSVNTPIKCAQADRFIARGIDVIESPDFGVILGEAVGSAEISDARIQGHLIHYPDPRKSNKLACDRVVVADVELAGRHDHLQAKTAVWSRMRWELSMGFGIRDKTPSDEASDRVLRDVAFVGEGLPYWAHPGCGGPLTVINCTHNGRPWHGIER